MANSLFISSETMPVQILAELEREAKDITADVMKVIAEDAPDEMRQLMLESNPSGKTYKRTGLNYEHGFHQASAEGEAPAIESQELFNSLRGKVLSLDVVEIGMAGHAFYLDPTFNDEPGGGYLNRPFIETGIERALDKKMGRL